jgi:hypothetical protein
LPCGASQRVFSPRQYRAFLGTKPGAADDLLVAKIRNLGHGRVLTLGFKTQLCHLSARPFYRAIGQENNRHRRMRSDLSIKTKLMILDYVLASPGQTWLATEEDKVDYFCCRLGIEPGVLPRKIYRSQAGDEATERHFVDKFPIAIPSESTSSPSVVSFTYIDEGSVATPGLATWLEQYAELFSRLDAFRVTFVATMEMNFLWAERVFRHHVASLPPVANKTADPPTDRLIEYFQLERQYRTAHPPNLDPTKLEHLKNLREQFGDRRTERLFEVWQQAGVQAVVRYLDDLKHTSALRDSQFSTCRLPWRYDIFRPLTGVPR